MRFRLILGSMSIPQPGSQIAQLFPSHSLSGIVLSYYSTSWRRYSSREHPCSSQWELMSRLWRIFGRPSDRPSKNLLFRSRRTPKNTKSISSSPTSISTSISSKELYLIPQSFNDHNVYRRCSQQTIGPWSIPKYGKITPTEG